MPEYKQCIALLLVCDILFFVCPNSQTMHAYTIFNPLKMTWVRYSMWLLTFARGSVYEHLLNNSVLIFATSRSAIDSIIAVRNLSLSLQASWEVGSTYMNSRQHSHMVHRRLPIRCISYWLQRCCVAKGATGDALPQNAWTCCSGCCPCPVGWAAQE
jgi:hypothetical protein